MFLTVCVGHELCLELDNDFRYVELRERNLSYSHTTLFHGKEVAATRDLLVSENDIRFHVQTHNPIGENNALFK